MCQKEGGLDAGLAEIRRSVIMGEGAFELGLTDRDNFKGEKLGINVSGERNSVNNGKEVEKGMFGKQNFSAAVAVDLYK